MLTLPASSSVLSGSLLIKHLSLLQAQMPPCALAGIYLSTSESSVDLSSHRSGGLGSGMISATRIKSKAQSLHSALCCSRETQPHAPGGRSHQTILLSLPSLPPRGARAIPTAQPSITAAPTSPTPAPTACPGPQKKKLHPWSFLTDEVLLKESIKNPRPGLHDLNRSPAGLLLLADDSRDSASPLLSTTRSAAGQISRTTVKQTYLSCS